MKELLQMVKAWDTGAPPPEDAPRAVAKYSSLLHQIEYFADKHWNRYLPAQHPDYSPDFLTRLRKWLLNVTDVKDQQLLFEFVPFVSFFSTEDFYSLYRSALNGPIVRWIVELEQITFSTPDFQQKLHDEVHGHTLFCPVTDSMNINEFYHANRISGGPHRPAFAPLARFGDPSKILAYMSDPDPRTGAAPFKRLVLLEDFVGSGTQVSKAVSWAATNLNDVPVLFVPLIVCPKGVQTINTAISGLRPRVQLSSVLEVKAADLLGPGRAGTAGFPQPELLEDLARRTFGAVSGGGHIDPLKAPYTPFGFRETGCNLVTYSNTPNNTLPILHHRSMSWNPLFPRSSRN